MPIRRPAKTIFQRMPNDRPRSPRDGCAVVSVALLLNARDCDARQIQPQLAFVFKLQPITSQPQRHLLDDRFRWASYWHDRICEASTYREQRRFADAVFLELLRRAGVERWRRVAMWAACRIYATTKGLI